MGRIIEALRKAGARADGTAPTTPLRPEPLPSPTPEPDEILPFIEVGARNAPLEASADVLAAGKAPAITENNQPVQGPVAAPVPALAVAFRPLASHQGANRPARKRFAPDLVALHDPEHAAAVHYRALFHTLKTGDVDCRNRVWLCTASRGDIDSATVVLNLAITAATAEEPIRVVVVDAHPQHAAVADKLGLPEEPGLQEVLAGKVSLKRALQDSGLANLHVLTAGKDTGDGLARLAAEGMRSVVRMLRQRFDLVILDAPAWDGRPAILNLSAASDAVYLMVQSGDEEGPVTSELLELIPQYGCPLKGCIVTQA